MELTREQQQAVNEIDHHLQIIACAGSGKTEVITRRIAHILKDKPGVKPENIVAFTFTEKAAASMKKRIAKAMGEDVSLNKMYIGTIHSFCYHLLKKYCDKFQDFKILDTVKSHLFVSRYYDHCGMKDLELSPSANQVRLFLECIEKMVDDYDERENWDEKHVEVFEKYRTCLFEHGYLDFSQLIFETIQQIRTQEVVQKYLSTIQYLVVDEYQDVDDLQEKLIGYFAKYGSNICVVGDDDQTIYQFRGSNANNMIQFSERYQDVTQVRLEQNFRCAKEIVDVADCVIRNNTNRIRKKMISGADLTGDVVIKASRYSDSQEQYEAIGEQMAALHSQGIPYTEMAVLVRKGKYIDAVCHALDLFHIPYATDSAEYFFKGEYFQRFVETMKILVNIDKAQLFECWQHYTDKAGFTNGFKYLRQVARSGGDGFALPLSGVIQEFLTRIAFLNPESEDYQERMDDLQGFVTILDDYDEIFCDQQLSARITGVLNFLENQAAEEYKYHNFKTHSGNDDCVQIMTVHKSKGLEFHTVFIPEMEEREFPVSNRGGKKYWHVLGGIFEEKKAKFESDVEDERKLFYVGITRAKNNLYLLYELSKKNLSIFVKEAAGSKYLSINRADLVYEVPKKEKSYASSGKYPRLSEEEKAEREARYQAQREYWEMAKTARRKLMDYYGSAMHSGIRGAGGDLIRVKNMSDDEVIAMAQRNRLI